MKRFKSGTGKQFDDARANAFMAELLELCWKHGVSIGHEDTQVGFLLHPWSPENEKWLNDAGLAEDWILDGPSTSPGVEPKENREPG